MQAIILAAGMGKRLKELTQNNTKCMVKVNGVSLIDRLLHQLEKHHLSRIVIVVGYEGQKLIDYIATLGIKTPISYVDNAVYDKTNNIYSLALAKNYLMEEDTLLFESEYPYVFPNNNPMSSSIYPKASFPNQYLSYKISPKSVCPTPAASL